MAFTTTTYRAAYINNGSGVVLTTPEQSGLSDDALLAAATAECSAQGLDVAADEIVIGEWRE